MNAELEEEAVCQGQELCVNTEGSYRCVAACPTGFQADPYDPDHCLDVDECLGASHACTPAEK